MTNPWGKLGQDQYVLPEDKSLLDAFNMAASERHKFGCDLVPEPFLGRPDAPLVLLNLNPGRRPQYEKERLECHRPGHPVFLAARQNLVHGSVEYPFFPLNPALKDYPGSQWWKTKLGALIDRFGVPRVSNSVQCVEYYPYHSEKYTRHAPPVPSQEYSFDLVRRAMKRNAIIIFMRAKKEWCQDGAVPELKSYGHKYSLDNPQNPCISENDLKKSAGAWTEIITQLNN